MEVARGHCFDIFTDWVESECIPCTRQALALTDSSLIENIMVAGSKTKLLDKFLWTMSKVTYIFVSVYIVWGGGLHQDDIVWY